MRGATCVTGRGGRGQEEAAGQRTTPAAECEGERGCVQSSSRGQGQVGLRATPAARGKGDWGCAQPWRGGCVHCSVLSSVDQLGQKACTLLLIKESNLFFSIQKNITLIFFDQI